MGEIAEGYLNGFFCQCCGEAMPDLDEPGYPRTCDACADEGDDDNG